MIHVLLPAYNEERAIGPTIEGIAAMADGHDERFRVILVDDGSTDATVAVGAATAARYPYLDLMVHRHVTNQGLGGAIRTGVTAFIDSALADDVLVALDADSTHPGDLIPGMVERVRAGADVVIASRYVPGATVTGVPTYRRLLSDGGRFLFRVSFPIPGVRDYTCGFRAYAAEPLRRARLVYGDDLCTRRGFEATVDLLLRLRQVGIRAEEVPLRLDYSARAGQSKMRVGRTVRASLGLVGLRLFERFTTYSTRRVRHRLEQATARAA